MLMAGRMVIECAKDTAAEFFVEWPRLETTGVSRVPHRSLRIVLASPPANNAEMNYSIRALSKSAEPARPSHSGITVQTHSLGGSGRRDLVGRLSRQLTHYLDEVLNW